MKKILIIIGAMLLLSSCQHFARVGYSWVFINNSNREIYIVLDTDACNGVITEGNMCAAYVHAHSERNVYAQKPWSTIVKDSMYVYVIDGSLIDLPINDLSPENAERITPEMVLARKTIYNSQTYNHLTLTYP